jgi:hypothetical protein
MICQCQQQQHQQYHSHIQIQSTKELVNQFNFLAEAAYTKKDHDILLEIYLKM